MVRKLVAALACAGMLSACSTGTSAIPPGMHSAVALKSLKGLRPSTVTPIQHVIVMIQENRTFDNLFNGFPGADYATQGRNHKGESVTLQPEGLEWQYDPSHSHANLGIEYDNGKMDGFDLDKCDADPLNLAGGPCKPPKHFTYSYVPPAEVQWYWLLAGQYGFAGKGYGLADHFFAARQVPSFPGHQYLVAAQSLAYDNPIGPGERTDHSYWGCDAPAGARVAQWGKTYNAKPTYGPPCFDYQAITDLLDANAVSWKYYTGPVGTYDGTLSALGAIHHIRYGTDWNNVVTPESTVLTDIANGTLPAVSFVTPPFGASDHGAELASGGPSWIMSVYVALTENPALYNTTTVLVTWDDSGGWYDHVAPPKDKFGPLGFRVPLIVISPYAKEKVSHATHTFGSILHYIESTFALGSLGQFDATSDDLSDMFNYTQKPIAPITSWGTFKRTDFEKKYTPSYWQKKALDTRPIDTDQ